MDTTPLHLSANARTEQPIDGLVIEHLHQGRVIVFTFTTQIKTQVADLVFKRFQQYTAEHGNSHYIIYDSSSTGMMALNPYFARKLNEMSEAHREARGRVAIVVPPMGPLHVLIEHFIRQRINRLQPHLQVSLFWDRQRAISWVLEKVSTTD